MNFDTNFWATISPNVIVRTACSVHPASRNKITLGLTNLCHARNVHFSFRDIEVPSRDVLQSKIDEIISPRSGYWYRPEQIASVVKETEGSDIKVNTGLRDGVLLGNGLLSGKDGSQRMYWKAYRRLDEASGYPTWRYSMGDGGAPWQPSLMVSLYPILCPFPWI